jgi:hypothetical protein
MRQPRLTWKSFTKDVWYPLVLIKPNEGFVTYIPGWKGKLEPYLVFTARIYDDKPRVMPTFGISFPYWRFTYAMKQFSRKLYYDMQNKELYIEICKGKAGKMLIRNPRVL